MSVALEDERDILGGCVMISHKPIPASSNGSSWITERLIASRWKMLGRQKGYPDGYKISHQ